MVVVVTECAIWVVVLAVTQKARGVRKIRLTYVRKSTILRLND
jgi:hypothetical protein